MFDTHCHLNFKRFKNNVGEVVLRAREAGITEIVIPGTDIKTSARAVELARAHHLFAAVGIHPHHLFELAAAGRAGEVSGILQELGTLLEDPCVLAVGEVGIDRHEYIPTKYPSYAVSEEFVTLQKTVLAEEMKLAARAGKSLLLHNREAKKDLLDVLSHNWDAKLAGRTVFHGCEPDPDLLAFAAEHRIFIGVDGDVTYDHAKQEFVKRIPPDYLVLETDAPYLLPEPLRTEKKYPNEPAYLTRTAAYIARLTGTSTEELGVRTTRNARRLFGLPEKE